MTSGGDKYEIPAAENRQHGFPSLPEVGQLVHVQGVDPRHRVQRHAGDPQQQLNPVHRIEHFGRVYERAMQPPYLLQREVAVRSTRYHRFILRCEPKEKG